MAQSETLHPDLSVIGYIPSFPIHNFFARNIYQSILPAFVSPKPSTTVVREDTVIQGAPDAKGQTRSMRLFVTRPIQQDGPLPVLLWIHGGGLVSGHYKEVHKSMDDCTTQFGALVVSPDYRVAPGHSAPAAQEDCYATWQWLIEQAQDRNLDLNRMAIGGFSAGGGLAAAVAQRIYDNGGPQPKLQVLVYPMLDDRTALKPKPSSAHHVWPHDANIFGWTSYLNAPPGSPEVPLYSVPARRHDVTGLSPAWIGCGSMDLFLEEDLEYAKRLEAAGVEVETLVVPRACHGFDIICPTSELSIKFTESYMAALRRAWNM